VDQLLESKKISVNFKKQAKLIDKKKYEEFINESDSITKKIDGLIDEMLGKEDKRQGITATKDPTNISYLNTASFYIRSLQDKPGKTEMNLLKNANVKIDKVVSDINSFYNTDWLEYRKKAENLKLSPFKDYKDLK
jgi:hypothetical protein